MTDIRLDVNIPTVTGNKVTDQLMTWTPTRRRIDSEGVKLPRPFNVNPAYTPVISVDPTGDGWAYAVTEPGDPTARYFTVPDTEEELLYSQLARVDASQIDQGDTLWWAELDRQVVEGTVNDDGVLYFRRRNGEVIPAGYVKGDPGPRGLRGPTGPEGIVSDQSLSDIIRDPDSETMVSLKDAFASLGDDRLMIGGEPLGPESVGAQPAGDYVTADDLPTPPPAPFLVLDAGQSVPPDTPVGTLIFERITL